MGQDGVNLGGKIRHKEGYFPVPPTDTQQDIRSEMILEMEKVGHRRRETSPRSGHGRPGGDRYPVRLAGAARPTK